MTRPTSTVVQTMYQNPHAENALILPMLVVCNTPDEELHKNIIANSAKNLPWVNVESENDDVAVLCGGGPSLADNIDSIRDWQSNGAIIFAMNGASGFLRKFGIIPDYQVIADAKPETAILYDPGARHHLLASQVDERTIKPGNCTTLWHLAIDEEMDRLFPEERRKRGGYSLIGGGAAVGNSAMCLAYVMGYRRLEVYGYDSSHRDEASHAYDQPMNQFIPVVDVDWAGKKYKSSVAMKAQAEKFQITGQALIAEGCTINVHGDGLLPAMWNTDASNLTERDKYRLMWSSDSYRHVSPGENLVPFIVETLKPDSLVIDFGCGSGRASLELAKRGIPVLLIDFADNCRDEEAMDLPFLEWDLTQPMPPHAHYGICCDVMEHIPTPDVATVIKNIMAAADTVFFQISTVEDHWGGMIDSTLHVTVENHAWWKQMFANYEVTWELEIAAASLFIVRNKE